MTILSPSDVSIREPSAPRPDKPAGETALVATDPPGSTSRWLRPSSKARVAIGLATLTTLSSLLWVQQPEDRPRAQLAEPGRLSKGPTDDPSLKPTADRPKTVADVIERVQRGIILITALDSSGRWVGESSGFPVDRSGPVATNHHMARDAARASAQFRNGTRSDVKGHRFADPKVDLATQPAQTNAASEAPDPLVVALVREFGRDYRGFVEKVVGAKSELERHVLRLTEDPTPTFVDRAFALAVANRNTPTARQALDFICNATAPDRSAWSRSALEKAIELLVDDHVASKGVRGARR